MNKTSITVARLFDGEIFHHNCQVVIHDGRIAKITPVPANVEVEYKGLLVPGFIDLQVNGGGGVLFNTTPTLAGIRQMFSAHAKFGTTAMLPTFITDNVEQMALAAEAVSQAIAENTLGILGIHFEGPHLSVAKKGAHSAEFIREISDAEWQILSRKDLGQIIVTLAPENVSVQDISKMVSMGIKVCLGHTNAGYQTAQRAIDAGASGFTHLYNAMSPMTSREPGVVGCALLNDQTYSGIIVDGHHVEYTSCEIALKAKAPGSVFLVTDAMPPVGTDDNEFAFFDRTVHLNDGKLTSTTGELAGSVLDMATAVKNTYQHVNVSLDEAVRMASLYPANYINQNKQRGLIKANYHADFVLLDDNLDVQSTWVAGQQLYKKQ
ncbi:N-acetylglucosamine-6-phosphate deacetylase [Thalassotalea eurytherma]|uniref:N-acetylgalactosamine-6-phosphate deacetylase n=1 Tax=Thalassotalea eurytherma TaxID=1144278 RepID=A0ABQ6GZU0_9GAMM|nr:N-acetylglucosamine-6-phosphate deacetylase [Thalassotalea eurytherma]GLX81372.1 N-acetylgalactosamine-6-phosphate deacetylase [Thalassotalea eurytherma]